MQKYKYYIFTPLYAFQVLFVNLLANLLVEFYC